MAQKIDNVTAPLSNQAAREAKGKQARAAGQKPHVTGKLNMGRFGNRPDSDQYQAKAAPKAAPAPAAPKAGAVTQPLSGPKHPFPDVPAKKKKGFDYSSSGGGGGNAGWAQNAPAPTPKQGGPAFPNQAQSRPGRAFGEQQQGKVSTVYHIGKPSGWAPSPTQNFLLGTGLIVLNLLTQTSGASLLARLWNAPKTAADVQTAKGRATFSANGLWTLGGEFVFVLVLSFVSGFGQTMARAVGVFFLGMYMVWLVFNGKNLANLPLIQKSTQGSKLLINSTDSQVQTTLTTPPLKAVTGN